MASELNNFLSDLVGLLYEKAMEARIDAASGGAMKQGRNFGLYEALSLVQQQAIAFGIEPEQIGFGNFDLDRDIL